MNQERIGDNPNNNNKELGEEYFEIISKKTLWKQYAYDAKKKASGERIAQMKVLDSHIVVDIPSRENIRYEHIRNLEEHNLTNNLVLNMIIRNKKFQNYMYQVATINFEFENKPSEEKEKYYKILQSMVADEFGFNIQDEINLIAHHPYINEKITDHLDNVANEILVLNRPFISDLKDGINKVMNFYLQIEQLYMLIPSQYEKINDENQKDSLYCKEKLYVFVRHLSNLEKNKYILFSVYEHYKDKYIRIDNFYYILPPSQPYKLSDIDEEIIKNYLPFICIPVETFGKEKFLSIASEEFPIELLEKEFRLSLAGDDFIDCALKDSLAKDILPSFKLPNSKSIQITINQDLSLEKQFEKIKQLHLNINKTKSFIEIFDTEIEKLNKVKNLNHIAKGKEKRNRDYANAFLIYDLYKIIGKEFNSKISELRSEAQRNKDTIENDEQYTKNAKEHEYAKIEEKLNNNLNLFNKTNLDLEIHKITDIEISKVRGLHSLMIEYIDECKFKNVILGK